jgi:RNA polymerase sigma factor (sigma-70 family)
MKMTATDLELLQQFVRDHSQDAFTALVNRHVNLVYSAALRQIRSSQLAEEITQSVFSDLAREANKLIAADSSPVLTAWLYSVARRTAIDVIRKESRRQLREQIAVEMNDMNATANDWTQIEPLLDDAMAALDETDRSAILLRYFENKNLREVGESLGTNEDAAQKRVSRAVEKLREFFSKRNVTIGACGLAVLISANAVQSAPIGLAATISAAAVLTGTVISTSAAVAITKTIAMTTLQKTFITAAFVATVGAGIFEANQAAQLRAQNQILQQQQTPLAEQIRQLQTNNESFSNRLVEIGEAKQMSEAQFNELLKLRGKAGSFHTQNDELGKLQSENLELKRDKTILEAEWNNVTNSSQIVRGPYWNRDSWADTGASDPQSALESLLWALRENNTDKIDELVATNAQNSQLIHPDFWNKAKGVHVLCVNFINGNNGQQITMIDTIVDKPSISDVTTQSSVAQDYLATRQTIFRWFLNKVNGQWQITGLQ